jgi:SAM-dependent methyltransferase
MEPGSFRSWLESEGVLANLPAGWALTEIVQVNPHTLDLRVEGEGEELRLRVARGAAIPDRWLGTSRHFKACYVGKEPRKPAIVSRILRAVLGRDRPDLEVHDRPEPEPEPEPLRREPAAPVRELPSRSPRRRSSMLDELQEIPVFDIELTSDCNKSCSYCPREALQRDRATMTDETIDALLRFVPERAFVGFAGIGEPLMHPRLFEVIRALRSRGERTINVTTNGSLLGPKIVERLVADPPDALHVSVHLDRRDDGTHALSEPFRRRLEALLPRLRAHMDVTVVLMEESYSPESIDEATEGWRAAGASVVEHRASCNRGGHLDSELVQLRTSSEVRGLQCSIFSRVTFVSSDGGVLACCNDVASQVRLGDVTRDSYSAVIARKREHVERDVWPDICARCDARKDVPPVSPDIEDAHPRLDIAATGQWVAREGGFALGRFHASIVREACTRVIPREGGVAIEILEEGVRAVLDRVEGGLSVLVAGDVDAVVLQSRALKRFGRPAPMVGFAMSAAAMESADRVVAETEGQGVLARLGAEVPWILFNRNDLAVLERLGVPANALHFGAAGTRILRMFADGMAELLDATARRGEGVFAGGRTLRDFATLAAAAPSIGAPIHVVGAESVSVGITCDAELDVLAFHRAMARARVVVVPLQHTTTSAGHLTIAAAQAMGKPVVASDVPGLAGYIEHGVTGLLVPPGDPAALARAVRTLLEDGEAADRMGRAGRDAEHARAEAFEDLLVGLAESALRARHAAPSAPLETRREPVHARLVLAGAARPAAEGAIVASPSPPWRAPAGAPEPVAIGDLDALRTFDRSGAARIHTGRDARLLVTELFEESAYEALLREPTSAESRVHCFHALRYLWAVRRVREALPSVAGPILDVGCGSGYGTTILRRSFDDVSGIDFDPAAIAIAKERWGRHLGNPERFAIADLLALDDPSSAWAAGAQAITCFECIEHLVDPVRGLRALRNLLAPGGLLLASVPFDSDSHHTVLFTCEDDARRLARTAFDDVQILRQEHNGKIDVGGRITPPESYLLICRR